MIKVLLKAPLLTQSGYGHHGRTILRALRTKQDIYDIYIQAINWGQTSWVVGIDEEREWIDKTLQKTVTHISNGGVFDVSLQVTIPNEWEKLAPVNIGFTAGIETTLVSPVWIEKGNLMDKIITISEHSKWSYEHTKYNATDRETDKQFEYKCTTPIEYVGYPVRQFEPKKIDLDLKTEFNFLSVSQISPRKNMEQLIRCFVDQFRDDKQVGLVVKTNIAKNSLIDRVNTIAKMRAFINNLGEKKCKVYLLHGRMTEEEMSGLYNHPKIKALVSATHGEGYGLPLFEAAYYGLPVAATDWSGHVDFLYKPTTQKNKTKKKHMFSRISYTMQPVKEEAVWDGVIQKESMWAVPEEGSIKMCLEELYKDHGRFEKRAKTLQKWIVKEYSLENINNKILSLLEDKMPVTTNEIDDLFKELVQEEPQRT